MTQFSNDKKIYNIDLICHCEKFLRQQAEGRRSNLWVAYARKTILLLYYMMTNKLNTVIYAGVTGDLAKRAYEHKNKLVKGFTSKYNITKLVYYEIYNNIIDAISREKQIKGGSRKKKIDLIKKENSEFKDLSPEVS